MNSTVFADDSTGAYAGDFLKLLKGGVMTLVVVTAYVGIVVSPVSMHPVLQLLVLISVALGSGASGAINMWYDRDIDQIMTRTKNRPIPNGRIAPHDALAFGIFLSILSVTLMALVTNYKAAALLLGSILFYVFVYTIWLKRRTAHNIVIGGAAGAFPPVIGWLSTGADMSPLPLFLFLIVFLWTPPHFWALALYRCDDYKQAGVPMLPVVRGVPVTKRHIFIYSILMALSTLFPWFFGYFGLFYGGMATALNALFLIGAFQVWHGKNHGERSAQRLFVYSIVYLFVLFFSMVFDKC